MKTFTFERFLFQKKGNGIDGHETHKVNIREGKNEEERAFKALFKERPLWGDGLPLGKDGQGWSSALIKYK